MNYRKVYHLLRVSAVSSKCFVEDVRAFGYCHKAEGLKAFIFIHPYLSYKEKLFTLAHELGHIFINKNGRLKYAFGQSENKANKFAVAYLKKLGINKIEYEEFYKKAFRYHHFS